MGLHMVALAKLKLLSSASHSICPGILAGLVCPFVLKLTFSFRHVRQAYIEVLYSFRLFVFQLGQIAFDSQEPAGAVGSSGSSSRWERAIRLVSERLAHVRGSPPSQSDEDNFHTLTSISL